MIVAVVAVLVWLAISLPFVAILFAHGEREKNILGGEVGR